jgi:hypothetical protein
MGAAPAFTPVLNYYDFVPNTGFSGRLRVSLWARSAGIAGQAQLLNVTDATAAGTTGLVTSVTRAAGETTVAVTIVANKRYRLYAKSNVASADIFCIGILEPL